MAAPSGLEGGVGRRGDNRRGDHRQPDKLPLARNEHSPGHFDFRAGAMLVKTAA